MFAGPDGKFWNVGDDNMVYSDDNPSKFQFQFCGGSMLVIKAPNGKFLKGEQNGLFKAVGEEICSMTLWEF